MKVRLFSFNIYLALMLVMAFTACKSTPKDSQKKPPAEEAKKHKKKVKTDEAAIIRLHFEANPDPAGRTGEISVFREHPVVLTVDRVPEINESNIEKAEIVDSLGGFALKITLNHSGTLLLENSTTIHRGQHMAIFCQFGKQKGKTSEVRWLGAPIITQPIRDGVLVFTPDATREECERIVAGVNFVADKMNDSTLH